MSNLYLLIINDYSRENGGKRKGKTMLFYIWKLND